LNQNTSELQAITGALPRTRSIRRTTRGTRTSVLAAAIRTTTIRTISLALGVLGVLNKTSTTTGHHLMTRIYLSDAND